MRADLCAEAIRLGILLGRLVPEDGEVVGLTSLMELTHARGATRLDAAGDLVLLDEQDRSRWDRDLIDRAVSRLSSGVASMGDEPIGPYRAQAEVARIHAVAPTAADAGLAEIDRLDVDGRLDGYHLLHSARADLLRRLDRRAEAAATYRRALALVATSPERRFLERRLAEVAGTIT